MTNDFLPRGLKDYSMEETELRDSISNKIFEFLKRGGCNEIEPSLIDFASNLEMEKNFSDNLFKFIDKNGKLLAISGDITPSIVRMLHSFPMPQRVFYNQPVFNYVGDKYGNRSNKEFGAQIYGIKEAEGDAEIIALAVESIAECGIKDTKIILSHAYLFKSILNSYKISGDITQNDIKELVSTGKNDKINEVCSKIIATIAEKKGSISILQEVADGINNREAIDCLLRLFEIYQILSEYGFAENIIFDFGYLSDIPYYNGMIFKILKNSDTLVEGGHFSGYKYTKEINAASCKYDIKQIINNTNSKQNIEDDKNILLGIANSIAALNKAYKVKKSLMESDVKIFTLYKVSKEDLNMRAKNADIANVIYINEKGEIEN